MSTDRSRRRFLRAAGLGAMAMASQPLQAATEPASLKPAQTAIPRWRGFNLLHFFQAMSRDERGSGAIQEDDCRWIRDWGFDFIRIPMDYWLWVDSDWQKTRELHPDGVFRIKESALEQVDRDASYPRPSWPVRDNDGSIKSGRADLQQRYAPWAELGRKGIGVHCGECGCYNKTPYDVFIAWFGDVMDILREHGIGYALWNFRGSFGILDSGRRDAEYEDWHGHQLDRRLLTMLQEH